MIEWRLLRADSHELLVPRLELAVTFWRRFLGLQGRRELAADAGLLLAPCNSIHTCFLRFPLDVVFLDRFGRVLEVREALRPWRGTRPIRHARAVLELPAGANRLGPGDAVALGAPADVVAPPRSLADFPLVPALAK